MFNIRIIGNKRLLERQLPNNSDIINNCKFIFEAKEKYDYLVVLDDLPSQEEINVPKERTILYTGEPPFVKIYPRRYLNQFGHIFTCQKCICNIADKITMPALPWMVGYQMNDNGQGIKANSSVYDYRFFKVHDNEDRLDKICLFTSNKKLTKGHRKRLDFALKIKEMYSDLIDIYGNGFNHIDDKYDVLSKYKYSIIIENCSYPNYWTEKLGDCYLSGCYPIYYGAPNILDYFDEKGLTVIDINNFKKSCEIIETVLKDDYYTQRHKSIIKAKNDILDKYNLFNIIADDVLEIDSKSNVNPVNIDRDLYPIRYKILDKIKMKILRNV